MWLNALGFLGTRCFVILNWRLTVLTFLYRAAFQGKRRCDPHGHGPEPLSPRHVAGGLDFRTQLTHGPWPLRRLAYCR